MTNQIIFVFGSNLAGRHGKGADHQLQRLSSTQYIHMADVKRLQKYLDAQV